LWKKRRNARFAPVDNKHDFSGLRRKFGSSFEDTMGRAKLAQWQLLVIQQQIHIDFG